MMIETQKFADLKKRYTELWAETLEWPNSFGHAFNTGKLAALMEIEHTENKDVVEES